MRSLLVLFSILSFFTVYSQAKMQIKDAKKNFGLVKKGDVVKVEYEITNAGKSPLIITDCEISCSCTTVDFPKQPIAHGQKATVLIIFDTKTVYDRQDRTVNLISNDPSSPQKLRYKGIVLTK